SMSALSASLHSFPTRRSSDLIRLVHRQAGHEVEIDDLDRGLEPVGEALLVRRMESLQRRLRVDPAVEHRELDLDRVLLSLVAHVGEIAEREIRGAFAALLGEVDASLAPHLDESFRDAVLR